MTGRSEGPEKIKKCHRRGLLKSSAHLLEALNYDRVFALHEMLVEELMRSAFTCHTSICNSFATTTGVIGDESRKEEVTVSYYLFFSLLREHFKKPENRWVGDATGHAFSSLYLSSTVTGKGRGKVEGRTLAGCTTTTNTKVSHSGAGRTQKGAHYSTPSGCRSALKQPCLGRRTRELGRLSWC